jgi:hypothetical protein
MCIHNENSNMHQIFTWSSGIFFNETTVLQQHEVDLKHCLERLVHLLRGRN